MATSIQPVTINCCFFISLPFPKISWCFICNDNVIIIQNRNNRTPLASFFICVYKDLPYLEWSHLRTWKNQISYIRDVGLVSVLRGCVKAYKWRTTISFLFHIETSICLPRLLGTLDTIRIPYVFNVLIRV